MAIVKKPSQKSVMREERRQLALELRKGGASFRDIARTLIANIGLEELGLKKYSHVTAYRDVVSALKELQEVTVEKADQVRTLQMERLTELLESVWEKSLAGDIQAVNTTLRVMQQINTLHGLEVATVDLQSLGKSVDIAVKEIVVELPSTSMPDSEQES